MDQWIKESFLDNDPQDALNQLTSSFTEHVIPFLTDWWSYPNPIPTDAEIAAIRRGIDDRKVSAKLPPAYEKLPDLLSVLAQGMRFNKRNFVNIHPSPFIPSALASFLVALQNSNNIVEEVSNVAIGERIDRVVGHRVIWNSQRRGCVGQHSIRWYCCEYDCAFSCARLYIRQA
jgi:hypothetical protein